MVTLKWIGVALGALFTLWLSAMTYVGISGEVVYVTTTDETGAKFKTPLWIVEHDGRKWLRADSKDVTWLPRLETHPRIGVQRGEKTTAYDATLVAEATSEVDRLMAAKYGFADRLVGALVPGSRGASLAIRLDPAS